MHLQATFQTIITTLTNLFSFEEMPCLFEKSRFHMINNAPVKVDGIQPIQYTHIAADVVGFIYGMQLLSINCVQINHTKTF